MILYVWSILSFRKIKNTSNSLNVLHTDSPICLDITENQEVNI